MTKKNKNLIYAGLIIGGLAYFFRKKKGATETDVPTKGGGATVETKGGGATVETKGGGATVETKGDVNTPLEVFDSNTDTETFRL
jgi:LPXTG-motif cell wall-anchored protein